ncbi:MAG: hypothetical protein D3903_21180 [Candidatus Electrothrix sp. GM3_4]|nr:hypothetical protein [Candidatus Electrothrix sp. GM3_4]
MYLFSVMITVLKDAFAAVSGCHSLKNKFRIYLKYLPYYSLISDELSPFPLTTYFSLNHPAFPQLPQVKKAVHKDGL